LAATDTLPNTTLRVSRIVNASPDRVYRAWSSAEQLKKWHAPFDYVVAEATVDLRVGGRFRIAMKPPDKDVSNVACGEYREIVPNKKLVFTWNWEKDTDKVGETLVTIVFNARGNETEIVLTHERFPNSETRDHHTKGWNGCVDKLAAYLT